MSEYTVRGSFLAREDWQDFETTIEADNESVARERAYSTLGSRHDRKRTQIEIDEVVAAEEVAA